MCAHIHAHTHAHTPVPTHAITTHARNVHVRTHTYPHTMWQTQTMHAWTHENGPPKPCSTKEVCVYELSLVMCAATSDAVFI